MRTKIKDFTNLEVWQKAHKLVLKCYKFSDLLPEEEKFNRKTQITRSASSVTANIAEGYGRFYYKENISFCRKARGSLDETKNHIITARDLNQVPKEICDKLLEKCEKVRQILNGYIRYLGKQT